MSLSEGAERFPDLVGERLGTIVPAGTDPFVAINDAGWSGGALVYVPRNTAPEQPDLAHRDPAGRRPHASTGGP